MGTSFSILKIKLVGVGFEAGLGIEGEVTAHLVDMNNVLQDELTTANGDVLLANLINLDLDVQLHVDLCEEVTTYGILNFKIDSNTALYKVLSKANLKDSKGKSINYEISILGKDNCPLGKWHWEDGNKVAQCTRKYDDAKLSPTPTSTPSELDNNTRDATQGGNTSGGASGETEQTHTTDIISGNKLDIDSFFINVSVGSTSKVNIIQFPEGYDMSDIKFSVNDTSVATIDSSGLVTGVAEGTSLITISTTDGKFSVETAVSVSGDQNKQTTVPTSYLS